MSLIVILACLALQWFLSLSSSVYQFQWSGFYIQWMRHQFSKLMQGHGLFAVLILVLPLVIIASLIFTAVYHLTGFAGYSVLSLALVWYCIDVVMLKQTTLSTNASDFFVKSYGKIFAPMLWYFVFGPIGLVLYVVVGSLCEQLPDQKYFVLTKGVLDWVPVRVLGLTFALAGNFGTVFKLWMTELLKPVADHTAQVTAFGEAALGSDSDAMALVRRTLLIWLVLMALITVGRWIG